MYDLPLTTSSLPAFEPYKGSDAYALGDWRRRINDLYSQVRSMEEPQAAWELWHTVRSQLFANHPLSPIAEEIPEAFESIEVFDYDPVLRFAVDLKTCTGETQAVELGGDGRMLYSRIARTDGLNSDLGNELDVFWIEGYGGGLFIPFRDASSGSETYGGGRYIVDAIKGSDLGLRKDGKLILDFNFAYNPSCSMSDKYVCPLAPQQNVFPVKILAGEKSQSWLADKYPVT